jgi:hypothetical protein
VRVLAERRPPDTIAVFLAYLPSAPEEGVEEAVAKALLAIGLSGGQPDPALVTALSDREPARRAAAAYVVGRAAPEARRAVVSMMSDLEPRVRFQAACALVQMGDKLALPTLVALLDEGPRNLAWQAEDMLARIAGEQAPPVTLGGADEPSRHKCRVAWEAWCRFHQDKLDLARLSREETLLGLTVICDCTMNGNGQSGSIWECGLDGKVRWKIDRDLRAPSDVQLLPGGRLLIADFQGNVVLERDQRGKVFWSRTVDSYPTSCQRLSNGNTFIATYNQMQEVTRDNKVVFTIRPGGNIYRARKLRNDHILYLNSNAQIVETETSGKVLRRVTVPTGGAANWGGVELLPNGRYLVCIYSANKVLELDAQGKVFWECSVQTPSSARRLPNGRTLVSSMDARAVVEFDRFGKEVWKQTTQGRPFFVLRH